MPCCHVGAGVRDTRCRAAGQKLPDLSSGLLCDVSLSHRRLILAQGNAALLSFLKEGN